MQIESEGEMGKKSKRSARQEQAAWDARQKLARELHDEMGQLLNALRIGLKSLESSIQDGLASRQLRDLQKLVDDISREIHRIALELSPTPLCGTPYLDHLTGLPVGNVGPEGSTKELFPGSILSEREGEVLRLIAQGHSNKDIANQLNLSVKTVETYKTRSMDKMGLQTRADIVRYAYRQGWLQNL